MGVSEVKEEENDIEHNCALLLIAVTGNQVFLIFPRWKKYNTMQKGQYFSQN